MSDWKDEDATTSSSNTTDMNKSISSSQNSNGSIDEISKDDLLEIVVEQADVIDEQADVIEETRNELDDLRNELDETQDELQATQDELSETQDRLSKQVADDRKRISSLEDQLADVEPTPHGSQSTMQDVELTPMERIARSDDVSEINESPTVERAVALFRNLTTWGNSTTRGYTLRPADNPLSLLQADQDEDLYWSQYYRACRAVEELTKGAVTFVDTEKHGKTLVLHEDSEVYQRLTTDQAQSQTALSATT